MNSFNFGFSKNSFFQPQQPQQAQTQNYVSAEPIYGYPVVEEHFEEIFPHVEASAEYVQSSVHVPTVEVTSCFPATIEEAQVTTVPIVDAEYDHDSETELFDGIIEILGEDTDNQLDMDALPLAVASEAEDGTFAVFSDTEMVFQAYSYAVPEATQITSTTDEKKNYNNYYGGDQSMNKNQYYDSHEKKSATYCYDQQQGVAVTNKTTTFYYDQQQSQQVVDKAGNFYAYDQQVQVQYQQDQSLDKAFASYPYQTTAFPSIETIDKSLYYTDDFAVAFESMDMCDDPLPVSIVEAENCTVFPGTQNNELFNVGTIDIDYLKSLHEADEKRQKRKEAINRWKVKKNKRAAIQKAVVSTVSNAVSDAVSSAAAVLNQCPNSQNARQKATAKRERENGKFKKAQVQWVSVTELFGSGGGNAYDDFK